MSDLLSFLDTLKRPRLLISAARVGVAQYRRDIHLPRHLGALFPSDATTALERLIELEFEIDMARRARKADYAVARHVDILIAIMGEARRLRAEICPQGDVRDDAPAQRLRSAPGG